MQHLRFDLTVPNSLSQLQGVLSSAKLHTADLIWRRNKSLMKILVSKGPKIDPFGVPVIMSCQELKEQLFDYLDNQKEYLNLSYPDHTPLI